ncbi:MAG: hypothetical protein IJQ80_01570 [Clostridia bacterium]|nr:hypothetical protein [Clostridia bacterium]
MKKRFLSFALALFMFASAISMTGCTSKKEDDSSSIRVPITLTMWLPAAEGSEIDEESIVQVEAAINAYTQKNFTTAVKLKVFPAEDYDSFVLSKIYELKAAEDAAAASKRSNRKRKKKASDTTQAVDTTAEAEEVTTAEGAASDAESVDVDTTAADTTAADTIAAESDTSGDLGASTTDPNDYILPDDENGKKAYDYEYADIYTSMTAAQFSSYPQVESDQFDIFLIHGFDEFKLLNDDLLLTDISSNLQNESKALLSYINPAFIQGANYQGSYSFIPNNRAAGKAEVMLINKEVCEKLKYDPTRFDGVDKLFSYDNSGISFIEDVKKTLPDVIPVAGTYRPVNLKYYNEADDDSFSVLCSTVKDIDSFLNFSVQNVFQNTTFKNAYEYVKRINDISPSVDISTVSSGDFAVGFFTGSYDEIVKYADDYEIVYLQSPQLSVEDVYASGFAVSYYTKNEERAMEIITALNTDPELRTILQYGQQGVHWKYDVEDDSIIHRLNNRYQMDITETGNSFVTYPDDGVPMSYWDDAKKSNLELYIPYTYGFTYNTDITAPLLKELAVKSKDIEKRLDAMTYDQFRDALPALSAEVDAIACCQKLSYVFFVNTEKDLEMNQDESLWMLMNYYVSERGWGEQ